MGEPNVDIISVDTDAVRDNEDIDFETEDSNQVQTLFNYYTQTKSSGTSIETPCRAGSNICSFLSTELHKLGRENVRVKHNFGIILSFIFIVFISIYNKQYQ